MKTINNYVVRTDIVNSFLKDVSNSPLISAEKEKALFKEYAKAAVRKDENEMVRIKNEIITGNLRFLVSMAKNYATDDLFTDVVNIGELGMEIAFKNFDPESGNRFMTFARFYIQREISNWFQHNCPMVRPTNCARILPKVKKIQSQFLQENERPAEPAEIISILKEKYNLDADMDDILGLNLENIEDTVTDDEEYTLEETSEFNAATASQNAFVGTMEQEELSHNMSKALATLKPNEQTVVKMKTGAGYDKEYQFSEIGETLGITSERARQMYNSAIKKLRSVYVAAENN